eukprot:NODE_55_length_26219_cov_0.194908.p6 type:complete len:435 gc:universal NODE_55_length_26219_cov_0.194908:22173-20869(-)
MFVKLVRNDYFTQRRISHTMEYSEPIEFSNKSSYQRIDYEINAADKYLGHEANNLDSGYGIVIFQNPDYNIGCYTVANFLYIFDTATGIVSSYIEIPLFKSAETDKNSVECLYCCDFAIVNKELHVICGGLFGCVYAINLHRKTPVRMLEHHGGPIHCIKTNPNYSFIIASCSKDRTVKIWDLRCSKNFCDFITFGGLEGHRMQVNSLSWHSSGTKIASAGYDLRVCLWDIPEEHLKLWESDDNCDFDEIYPLLVQYPSFSTMMLHTSAVDCVLWLDTMILTKAADGEIVCWLPATDRHSKAFHLDVERLEPVNVILKMKFQTEAIWFIRFAYCRANNHIVCGNSVGTIFFWNLKSILETRNDIVNKSIMFGTDKISEMTEALNKQSEMISFLPGAAYNYSQLNGCLRNFAFTARGEYCYALNEKGSILRFKSK